MIWESVSALFFVNLEQVYYGYILRQVVIQDYLLIRLCSLCPTTEPDIKDETHVLLNCDLYNDSRLHKISDLFREIPQGTDNEELTYVVTHHPRKFAKFLLSAYLYRMSPIYSWFSCLLCYTLVLQHLLNLT